MDDQRAAEEESIERALAWITVVADEYNQGQPEAAWDQAGEILDLCLKLLKAEQARRGLGEPPRRSRGKF